MSKCSFTHAPLRWFRIDGVITGTAAFADAISLNLARWGRVRSSSFPSSRGSRNTPLSPPVKQGALMAKNLWSMKGRISRGTFWFRVLAAAVPWGIALAVCKQNVANNGPFPTILASVLVQAACIAFIVVQGAKRMHDVNKHSSMFLIPVYGLIEALVPGTPGTNRFGEPPE